MTILAQILPRRRSSSFSTSTLYLLSFTFRTNEQTAVIPFGVFQSSLQTLILLLLHGALLVLLYRSILLVQTSIASSILRWRLDGKINTQPHIIVMTSIHF